MPKNVTLSTGAVREIVKVAREAFVDEAIHRRLGKAPHEDHSYPGAMEGRRHSEEPEDEGFALHQVGGGDLAEPARGIPSGRRSASYGTRRELEAVGHAPEFDTQLPSVSSPEALSAMLERFDEGMKSIVRSQNAMAAAFAKLLKAAENEGSEAEGDWNEQQEANPQNGGQEEGEEEEDAPNQHEWADGEEAEKARKASELDEVLRGQRILNANLTTLARAVSGRGWGDVPSEPLSDFQPKSLGGAIMTADGRFIRAGQAAKAKEADWYGSKRKLIAEAEDDGRFTLGQVLASEEILMKCEGCREGAAEPGSPAGAYQERRCGRPGNIQRAAAGILIMDPKEEFLDRLRRFEALVGVMDKHGFRPLFSPTVNCHRRNWMSPRILPAFSASYRRIWPSAWRPAGRGG
jgi:hypothetical protein